MVYNVLSLGANWYEWIEITFEWKGSWGYEFMVNKDLKRIESLLLLLHLNSLLVTQSIKLQNLNMLYKLGAILCWMAY